MTFFFNAKRAVQSYDAKNLQKSRLLRLESLENRELLAVDPAFVGPLMTEANDTDNTIIVNSSKDNMDEDDFTTLREAIAQAVAGDTITFDASLQGETILLLEGQIEIDKSLTIDASSLDGGITIDGYEQTRIFKIANGTSNEYTSVTFKNLTLTNGYAQDDYCQDSWEFGKGGAVYIGEYDDVSFEDCVFTRNNASAASTSSSPNYGFAYGGAIYVGYDSKLTLQGGKVANNKASAEIEINSFDMCNPAVFGGGIYADSDSTLTLENVEISNNSALVNCNNYSSEVMSVSVRASGGGIYAEGDLTLIGSTILNNEAEVVYTLQSAEIPSEPSTITTAAYGGGICANDLTLTNTEVSFNSVSSNGPSVSEAGGDRVAYGGGIYVLGNSATLTNATISHNYAKLYGGTTDEPFICRSAGGGIYAEGLSLALTNVVVSNNETDDRGGGCYVKNTVALTNVTVAGNIVGYNGDGGGIYADYGSKLTLENAIIAINSKKAFSKAEVNDITQYGATITASNSLSSYELSGAGNVLYDSKNPLFTDAANGDYSLAWNAQAIDAGNDAYVAEIAKDIAGNDRIQGGSVDMGAYESPYAALTNVSITGDAVVGQTLSATAYVSDAVATATWQWYRGDLAIDGATKDSYTVVSDDCGYALKVVAVGKDNYCGTKTSFTKVVTPPPEEKSTIVTMFEDVENPYDGVISFREAISYAGDGAKITFDASLQSQTITLDLGEIVIDKNLTIDGTGAKIEFVGKGVSLASAPLLTTGDDYDGEGARRLFEVKAGCSLTLIDIALKNGYADYGGAIKNSGTLTLNGVAFENNVATKTGGAIFNAEVATLTINGGNFSNNSADNGGVIANYGRLDISDDYGKLWIEQNTSNKTGGAIFNAETATLTISGGNFLNNSATEDGGAIFNANGARLTISCGEFLNNSATEDGGVIFNAVGATLTINDGSFSENSAKNGGVIANYGTMKSSENYDTLSISSNRADNGGAIFNADGAMLAISCGNFTSNNAGNGGAIFNEEGATLTISSGNLSYNNADNGGAIANYGTMEISGGDDTPLLERNRADNGGAIFNKSNVTLTISGGKFWDNNADNGGVIFNDSEAMLTINSGNFSSNSASRYGGAIFNDVDATLTISDGNFSSNSASEYGGAIFNRIDATLTISGGSFLENRADNGGAIFNESNATLTISDGNFSSNSATEDGGAIFNESDVTLTISDGKFSNNSAGNGGAIANYGMMQIGETLFERNTANKTGGAIFNTNYASLKIYGGKFLENKSIRNGGAIFNNFDTDLRIYNGNFFSNSANNGGAVANYGDTVIWDKTTISGNTANRFGGAYFGCGELIVGNETLFELNVAGLKGGAIYNDVNNFDVNNPRIGEVWITENDVRFVKNSAGERGGAIQTYSTLSIEGTATFSGNKASGDNFERYGGAIDVGEGGSATLFGALTFEENTADFGGAIFSVGNLTFDVGTYAFKKNVADRSGGAIDALAGMLSLGSGTFTFVANEAKGVYDEDSSGLGGAIATAAATTTVDGASFVWTDEADPSKKNSAEKGNCVAFKDDCGISAQKFGLDGSMDYVIFNELIENFSSLQSLLPRSISPHAVEATITVEGVKTTFGAEGVTPQQLGLGVGTHEALVQYVDANGETSATRILKLTVKPGASVEVRETTIADGRGVKFDFNLTKADGGAVSVWEVFWGDGTTSRSENLSESWLAAHYYAQDGTFDVSLKVVYLDGTSETFEAFSTQKIGASVAKTEALSTVFEDVDDLFEDAFVEFENTSVYGPAFLR